MFVFPAFDDNYKVRKRTFKCCSNCRLKRVKCDITAPDYEIAGCSNCRKHDWECDLVTKKKSSPKQDLLSPSTVSPPVKPTKKSTKVEPLPPPPPGVTKKSPVKNEIRLSRCRMQAEQELQEMKQITPSYLKERFGFNVSGHDANSTFQYVYHDHPQVIISRQMNDNSMYHESGVYINLVLNNQAPDSNKYKSYKLKNEEDDKEFYIRSKFVYQYLVSIHAFTLSGPIFNFEPNEVQQLVELYFYKLNSIFPIVHSRKFWDGFRENKAPSVLVYTMVLFILRDNLAEPILSQVFKRSRETDTLSREEYVADFKDFITQLEAKIRQILLILPELGDIDKFTLLAVHLLLSLHFKFDHLGHERSSHDLTSALNLAGSLAIHHKSGKYKDDMATYTNNLWWVLYIFDRISAFVCSRFLFMRHDDFNIDLPYNNPHLLKLVQIAKSIEKLMFSIYQPFENVHRVNDTKEARKRIFDDEEFQRVEFEICDQERANKTDNDTSSFRFSGRISDLQGPYTDYTETMITFLARILNNVVVLASQKRKYDDEDIPNSVPEADASKASLNILYYIKNLNPDLLLNIPCIPWSLTIAMSLALKRATKKMIAVTSTNENSDVLYENQYEVQDYLAELENFKDKWYVIDEIHGLCNNFLSKLEENSKSKRAADERASAISAKRQKTKSQSSNLKLLPPVKSPQTISSSYIRAQTPVSLSSLPPVSAAQTPSRLTPILFLTGNSFGYDNEIDVPQYPNALGNEASTAMNNGSTTGYDSYLETMHIDMFDNEFFKDLPHFINFLP